MIHDAQPVRPGEPQRPKDSSTFGAGRAFLVLLSWIGGQLIGGFLGAMSAMVHMASVGIELSDAAAIERHAVELMTPALAVGSIVGAVTMFWAARALAKPHIRDTGPTGIGWGRVRPAQMITAALLGIAISSAFVLGLMLVESDVPERELGPVAGLAEQSERIRWIWAIIAVTIAPVTEEFLFRGVLFSGISRSWGVFAGATITSALFLMFHIAEAMAFWPSTVAIGMLTIGTIASRILTNRLGPPIAMHLAYNTVLAVALVFEP